MYKLQLDFDTENLNKETIKKIYEETDKIFAKQNLICKTTSTGKRISSDNGLKQDYGKFWAAIFKLKDTDWITDKLSECLWFNGNSKEDLITNFLRI